jgi:hypothetical protein
MQADFFPDALQVEKHPKGRAHRRLLAKRRFPSLILAIFD